MYLAGALLSSDHHPRWGLHVTPRRATLYRARRRSIKCALPGARTRTRWTDCGVGVGAVRACADAVLAVVGAAEAVAEQGAPRSIDELSHGWRAMACVRCSSMWSGSQTVPPTCSPAELQIEDSAKMTDTKMDLRGARLSPLTLTARNVTCACRRCVVPGGSLPVGRRAAQSYVVRVLQSHFFAGARAAPPSARAARKSIRPRAQRAAYGVAYPRSGATILLHFWRVWRRAPCCTRCWRRGSRAACTGRTPARCTASRGPWEAADGRTRDGLDFHKPQGRPIGLSSRLWGFLGTGKRFRLVSTRFSAVLRVFVSMFSFQVGLHEWRQVHGCGAC